jgi:hypothetical protein
LSDSFYPDSFYRILSTGFLLPDSVYPDSFYWIPSTGFLLPDSFYLILLSDSFYRVHSTGFIYTGFLSNSFYRIPYTRFLWGIGYVPERSNIGLLSIEQQKYLIVLAHRLEFAAFVRLSCRYRAYLCRSPLGIGNGATRKIQLNVG